MLKETQNVNVNKEHIWVYLCTASTKIIQEKYDNEKMYSFGETYRNMLMTFGNWGGFSFVELAFWNWEVNSSSYYAWGMRCNSSCSSPSVYSVAHWSTPPRSCSTFQGDVELSPMRWNDWWNTHSDFDSFREQCRLLQQKRVLLSYNAGDGGSWVQVMFLSLCNYDLNA